MSKYLEFIDLTPPNRKTKIFVVRNKTNKTVIAEIKWARNFRKYATFWENGIISDSQCERELADFKDKLMEERK